jgi:hypothetical protein
MLKVKRNGKTDIIETIKYNVKPRTNKKNRVTLKETIARAKRARRDARLVQMY